MRGLIKYSDLLELSLNNAITTIRNNSRIKYGDLKLSDLLLNGVADDLKLSDYTNPSYYGIGVYIFFDGDIPVYVGKADNFLYRLSSHRITDPIPNWGWNALLQKVCATRLRINHNQTREDLMEALNIVESFCVVRLLLDIDNAKQKLSRFERIIMKGIKHQSDTLLNGRIGTINEIIIQQPLKYLIQ